MPPWGGGSGCPEGTRQVIRATWEGGVTLPGGGEVETHHDHRLAMSGLILGLGAQNPVTVDDVAMIATSYPDFFAHMRALGATLEPAA